MGALAADARALGHYDAGCTLEPVTRYFAFEDLTPELGWALLRWCREAGADAFTLTALISPTESERMKAFFSALAVFELPSASRDVLSAKPGEHFTKNVPLWLLSAATEDLLRDAMPDGFTTSSYAVDLWLEDLAVYRAGKLMMGVVSHEGGGVLRVSEAELAAVRALGIRDRDSIAWVGY
jgi:hypothetical protein